MIRETNFSLPNQSGFYRGKVRDVYYFGDRIALISSDRISAFDVVLSQSIPFKGQVLNQIAAFFLQLAERNSIKTWFEMSPNPYMSYGKNAQALQVEIVVRGYLAGHAWREYQSGKREICGVDLPDGLNENDRLPYPIITPTTKAHQGHDQDISKDEIISKGLVGKDLYEQVEQQALSLFEIGSLHAKQQGLLLVDTKYEFGIYKGELIVIDEIHTPDSSRYLYAETYQQFKSQGLPQRQLSKEFVRKWLIEQGFQGKEGQKAPELDQTFVNEVSSRYIELYEMITGLKFKPFVPDIEEIKKQLLALTK